MPDAERLAEILGDWHERRERGEAVTPSEVIRLHPDLADSLRAHFEAMEVFDEAFGPPPPASSGAPRRIGDFTLLREIGRGGMGVVYEAEQTSMRRRVALKVLYPSITSSAQAVERFRREAQAAGRLHHTHIVPVYAMGEEDGVWFYAMELVRGRALDRVIRDLRAAAGISPDSRADAGHGAGAPPSLVPALPPPTPTGPASTSSPSTPSSGPGTGGTRSGPGRTGSTHRSEFVRVARAFAAVADALDMAHAAGVVHRDVKPSNLMLDEDGTLRLMDFGLARVEGEAQARTMTGEVLGTPQYMSPEQATGARSIDGRSDVYSLGATLYEALTLRPPFQGKDVADTLAAIRTRDPVSPRALDRRIPRDLETVVSKALEKDPARRYASAGEMARDLHLFADGGAIRAKRIGLLGRTWRRVKRHRALSALVAAVVILAGVGALQAIRASREAAIRRHAEYDALVLSANETASRGLAWTRTGVRVAPDEWRLSAQVFAQAIAIDPDRPEAFFGRALCCVGASAQARLADLEAARARGVGEKSYRVARAYVLRIAQRFDEAAVEDRLAADLPATGRPEDAYFRGRIQAALGDASSAIEWLTAALGPGASPFVRNEARLARAFAREGEGDLEGAVEDIAAVVEGGSTHPGLHARLASLWRRLGRREKSEAEFGRVLDDLRRRGQPEGWVDLCSALRAMVDLPSDEDWWDRASDEAVRLHPEACAVLRARADFLAAKGRSAERLATIERALGIAPRTVGLTTEKGQALLSLDRADDALHEFDHALLADPLDLEAAKGRAQALHALANDPAGEKTLREMTTRWKRDGDAWMALGEFLCDTVKAYDRAEEAFREAVRGNPGFAPYRYDLGNALTRRAKAARDPSLFAAAAAEFREAVRLDPSQGKYHDNLGVALQGQGDLDTSLTEFRQAVRLGPKDPLARFNLGTGHEKKGEWAEAIAAYAEAARLAPLDPSPRIRLAQAYLQTGDLESAKREAVDLVRQRPDDGSVRFLAGRIALVTGDNVAAERESRLAVAALPPDAGARHNLGLALRRLGKPAEAIPHFEEALRIGGPNAETWLEIGNARDDQGDKRGAIEAFRRAIAVDESFTMAWYNLGHRSLDVGDKEGAETAFLRVLSISPGDAQAHDSLGYVYLSTQRFEKAAEQARIAVQADPKQAGYVGNLGAAEHGAGRYAESLAHFRKAVDLSDDPVRRSHWEVAVRDAERLVRGATALERVAAGDALPPDAPTLFAMMDVAYRRRLYARSAQCGVAAAAVDPSFATGYAFGKRYDAACAAALAGGGAGDDAATLDAAGRARWRAQTLAWLREDLAGLAPRVRPGEPESWVEVRACLEHWKHDPDFARMRDGEPLPESSAEERAAWKAFWADVDAVLARMR
jgi:serine/threonine protein kinase/tetratricopeptide (TPR) repeat protein